MDTLLLEILLLTNWKEYYIKGVIMCIGTTNWIFKLAIDLANILIVVLIKVLTIS